VSRYAVRGKNKFSFVFCGTLLVLLLAAGCTGKENKAGAENAAAVQQPDGPAWPVVALLKTGPNPLWFELAPDGPGLIESPAEAALSPFTPWPHALHITGIEAWGGFLVMPVNRDGFLVLGPALDSADVMLYRAASGGLWEPYTTESFFFWEEKPAILLYRNDFFMEPTAPPLSCQVYVLDESSAVPLAASVPALQSFPSDGPWEAELVQRGSDGFWYYRMREKGKTQNGTAYFRTADLAEAGERVSVGEWRKYFRPGDNEPDAGLFSLPALPEGFAYTGFAALGAVVAASWEEQQEAGIGAAGFMVMLLTGE
jgi:hypothetical protein